MFLMVQAGLDVVNRHGCWHTLTCRQAVDGLAQMFLMVQAWHGWMWWIGMDVLNGIVWMFLVYKERLYKYLLPAFSPHLRRYVPASHCHEVCVAGLRQAVA
eukprot:1161017-Pelagomonas_calceolata.AAC.1